MVLKKIKNSFLRGILVKMKETIKKEQNKLILIYGTLFFITGLIGIIFPESSRFIMSFCFMFGGTSILSGLFYFAGKKINKTE